jgi:hypothetical protein
MISTTTLSIYSENQKTRVPLSAKREITSNEG